MGLESTWDKSVYNRERESFIAFNRYYSSVWTLCRFTSLMVFWFRARMISADAPRTNARFIFNKKDSFKLALHVLNSINRIHLWFCLNCVSYFIDHGICKGLLVSCGSLAVVHLHRHYSDPRLLLFGVVLTFSFAHLCLLVPDLWTDDKLDIWTTSKLFSKSPKE